MKWFGLVLACAMPAMAADTPTFYRDVLPVLQKHCQSCHRPGEIGPMPLRTYDETRRFAAVIRQDVTERKMPPWFADRHFGHFANDPSLTTEEIATIQAWADHGAPEGSPADAPQVMPEWPSGWTTIQPDIVFTMPKAFPIPAKSVIAYQYIIFPTHFSFDRWVSAVEVRPSDRAVVHHAVLYVREPGSKWLEGVPPGTMWAPPSSDMHAVMEAHQTKSDILAVYTPGSSAMVCPHGMAKKVPAGSDLVLQLHYTSRDVSSADQTRIGLVLRSDDPQYRILTLQMGSDRLVIPPGEPDYQVRVSGTMPRDAILLSMMPHMHLRGSEFEFQRVAQGGHVEELLHVKPFIFNWQLTYLPSPPIALHRGDHLVWIGHFNNSASNPLNPDPTAEVHWGEQSWNEMMIGFFDVAVEPDVDKQSFFDARDQASH